MPKQIDIIRGFKMIIDNVEIAQNENGLFLMRDLFKSSGAPAHKNPSVYLNSAEGSKMVKLLGDIDISRVRGAKGGIYASKHLVVAYATWVSPELFLNVIKAFERVATGDLKGAAIEADTDASRVAAVQLGMAYIESDRFMFTDKEKVIELLKSASISAETFKNRTKNNIKVEITKFLSKKRKSSDLITEVTRVSAFKHGVTSSYLVFECYNDMLEDGVIRSDGVYVAAI
jgi:hypothetical protein